MQNREKKYSTEIGTQTFKQLYALLDEQYSIEVSDKQHGWDTYIFVIVPETNREKTVRVTPSVTYQGSWHSRYPVDAKIKVSDRQWMKLTWSEEQQEWVIDAKKLFGKIDLRIEYLQREWQSNQERLDTMASNRTMIARDWGVEESQVKMLSEYAARVSYNWGSLKLTWLQNQYTITDVLIEASKVNTSAIETLVSTLDDILSSEC